METLCYGCMKMKLESPVCEHCGFDENTPNLPHQLPVGTLLRGQYRIGRVLGQGGFGITYLGWDTYLDTPVAIKEYFPGSVVNRDCTQSTLVTSSGGDSDELFRLNRERFLREAKVMARLIDLPEIVRVHNLFEENNTAYIIMEYIEGTDLRCYVRQQGGKLSPQETFRILRPIMDALGKVHQVELVHRDISPDNIMLLPDGTAKLLDFGAAREVVEADVEKNLAQSTEAILKHGFAPMEQYQKKGNLGPWTDVYALCASIYYCITGQVPPDAPGLLLGDAVLNWQNVSGLTQYQAAVLEKGMALSPKDRIRSVEELSSALFCPKTAPAEPLHQEAAGEKGGKRKKKKKLWVIVLLLVLAAAGAACAVYFNYHIWSEATCTEASRCSIRQQTRGEALGHSWQEGDCLTAKTCTVCGETEGQAPGHSWQEADCLTAKTCTVCGLTEGEPLGHSWVEATRQAPKTCSRCQKTEGTALPSPILDFMGSYRYENFWSRDFEFHISSIESRGNLYRLTFTEKSAKWAKQAEMEMFDIQGEYADNRHLTCEWDGNVLVIEAVDGLSEGIYSIEFSALDHTAGIELCYGLEGEPYLWYEYPESYYYFRYYTSLKLQNWKTKDYLVMSENFYTTSDTKPTTFGSQKKMFGIQPDTEGPPKVAYGKFFATKNYWLCGVYEEVYTLSSSGWYLACQEDGTLYLTQEMTEECFWVTVW